jgi:RNA polymerase primary sigma factor
MKNLKVINRLTKKDTKSIASYLNELKSRFPLDPEVEYKLAIAASQGDEKSKQKLIEANLKFVVSVAKQYEKKGILLEDLINEGNLGLIHAANDFDPTRGFKFISYAVWKIRQKIHLYIENQANTIRIPVNKHSVSRKIQKRIMAMEQKLERSPMYYEIVDELKGEFNENDIKFYLNKEMLITTSLDTPFDVDKDSGSLVDIIKNNNVDDPSEVLDDENYKQKRVDLLSTLTDKEAFIIETLYGINGDNPYTPEEVAKELRVTVQDIYQTRKRALKKLKFKLMHRARWMIEN